MKEEDGYSKTERKYIYKPGKCYYHYSEMKGLCDGIFIIYWNNKKEVTALLFLLQEETMIFFRTLLKYRIIFLLSRTIQQGFRHITYFVDCLTSSVPSTVSFKNKKTLGTDLFAMCHFHLLKRGHWCFWIFLQGLSLTIGNKTSQVFRILGTFEWNSFVRHSSPAWTNALHIHFQRSQTTRWFHYQILPPLLL